MLYTTRFIINVVTLITTLLVTIIGVTSTTVKIIVIPFIITLTNRITITLLLIIGTIIRIIVPVLILI
ncbi:hypothetical protein [Bacillus sp. B4-WWTP-NA-D-NA-NA]|uniref:hypothetical protein n=1 Tax=Bacillus sp. B4-WWTP-NA-D-NA-NA TaxID=2653216 RepID=UPI00126209A5|nr:hypothetical protein [Bacillus sp. B4-WWTP-NA-D-NA-NA]